MTFMRRPRAFISYRHQEGQDRIRADDYNAQHRTWVNNFAQALASWNIDVVWDERLQQLFKPHSAVDPSMIPFLAEVTTLCLQVTQTFMPILTRGYLERALATPGGAAYGTVTEEWRQGAVECVAGRAEIVTIVREWPIPDSPRLPAPIANDNAWDFRFVAAGRDEVEFLGDTLHGLWDVERPQFDMPFRDWISKYLHFCVNVFGLPWPGVELWDCNFDRPRIFITHQTGVLARNPPPPDAGSQRDLREDAAAMQYKVVSADPNLSSEDPDEKRELEQKAKDLMRLVMETHVARYRKPFDFSDPAPGGRGSRGLYFGPTLRSFSYLHPSDPARAELRD